MPGKVDLNAASAQELSEIAGIDEGVADRIVEYRGQHGEFGALEDLERVEGINADVVNRVRDRLIVGEDVDGNAV